MDDDDVVGMDSIHSIPSPNLKSQTRTFTIRESKDLFQSRSRIMLVSSHPHHPHHYHAKRSAFDAIITAIVLECSTTPLPTPLGSSHNNKKL
jgi:hypothetical protein